MADIPTPTLLISSAVSLAFALLRNVLSCGGHLALVPVRFPRAGADGIVDLRAHGHRGGRARALDVPEVAGAEWLPTEHACLAVAVRGTRRRTLPLASDADTYHGRIALVRVGGRVTAADGGKSLRASEGPVFAASCKLGVARAGRFHAELRRLAVSTACARGNAHARVVHVDAGLVGEAHRVVPLQDGAAKVSTVRKGFSDRSERQNNACS